MGKLRRNVLRISEAAAPRGKIMRLQFRLTLDLLVTAAFTVFALASGLGFQVLRWRAARSRRP